MPCFNTMNCIQITETCFADYFEASHRLHRASTDFYTIRSVKSLKRDLLNDTTFNPPLFSLDSTFKDAKIS